ncbi:MAG: YtxH domain-containing protein [Armatimonadota bacterium]|nr:YtxH domain-containing protein [Armatimonadota bacterium]
MSRNQEDRGVFGHFMAGLGVGALIGAIAALLLAPKSGEETREDIARAAEELKKKANKVVEELSESAEELAKKSKELLETTKIKVQSAIEAGKEAVAKRKAGEQTEES